MDDYVLLGDGNDSIIVTYEGKRVTVKLASQSDPIVSPTQEALPTSKPNISPEPTATPKPTIVAKPTAVPKPTIVAKPTATPKVKKMTLKCNLKGVSLKSKSAKIKYNSYSKKTIVLTPTYTGGKVEYQIVKKGKKLSNSKWKKVKNKVSVTKEMKACVYFRYKMNGKYVIVKSSGFILDKTAPTVDVSSVTCKLKVRDTLSGISSIKVNGKKVKNGYVLKSGNNKIVIVDKAGNKKIVRCRIATNR